MSDLISREHMKSLGATCIASRSKDGTLFPIVAIDELPSIESEPRPISYLDCSNAMLKMWMDNVVTDGEYNRIMDKLNAKHEEDMRGEQDDKCRQV